MSGDPPPVHIGIATLKRLKLEAHPGKTQVVFVGDGTKGFDFLGSTSDTSPRGGIAIAGWPGPGQASRR